MDEQQIRKIVEEMLQDTVLQEKIRPSAVKQRHLEGNVIFFGVAADRPDGSTEVKVYFSTDTDTLNIWNGTAWVQEIFT